MIYDMISQQYKLRIGIKVTALSFSQFIADGPKEDLSMLPITMPMYAPVKAEVKDENLERTDVIKSKGSFIHRCMKFLFLLDSAALLIL